MNEQAKSGRGRRLVRFALVIAGLVGIVLILEGALSLGSTMLDISRDARPLPESRRFTVHDSVLGWTVESGLREADAYGEWRPLTTGPDGFRKHGDPSEPSPEGIYRIVCAGGASVFGVGVADADTWCARLGAAGPALESVNAGQPAYGPGQAWMLVRDRVAEQHDLLLFAIDGADMFRLLSVEQGGFPKPRVEPGTDGLVVNGTPVPRRPYLWPWMTYNASLFARSHLLAPLVSRTEPEPLKAPPIAATVVTSSLIPAIQEVAESRGAKLVVAYLPTHPALQGSAEPWRANLARELERLGVPFIDLTDDDGPRPAGPAAEMFGREAQLSAMGHQRVADALVRELSSMQGIGFPSVAGGVWRTRYFSDAVFRNRAATRYHGFSSLQWGSGSPAQGVPADGFSVIMESCLSLEKPQRLRVRLEADGPATFSVNQQTVLDTGEGEGQLSRVNAVDLPAGGNRLRIRYRDSTGPAEVRLLFRFEDGRVTIPGSGLVQPPGAADCAGGRSEGG